MRQWSGALLAIQDLAIQDLAIQESNGFVLVYAIENVLELPRVPRAPNDPARTISARQQLNFYLRLAADQWRTNRRRNFQVPQWRDLEAAVLLTCASRFFLRSRRTAERQLPRLFKQQPNDSLQGGVAGRSD
jgi:hypothetical protein